MRAAQRQSDASVIQRLLDEPYRFEFFQAVRLVEQWLREHGVAPERAMTDFVRFENSKSLGFPPSEIEAMCVRTGESAGSAADLASALEEGRPAHIRIRPAFMGLLGACGVLPLHYSERIAAYEHERQDTGPRAFLDLFSQRALALFYEAWTKYRVLYRLDRTGRDDFLFLLLAFAGAGPGDAGEELDDRTLAYFAAQMRARVVSGSVLGGVLSDYFRVPVAIEQFAGMWDVLGHDLQTTLGGSNCVLGGGATAGERIWRSDLNIRVRIGPVGRQDFDRFLPGAAGSRALARLVGEFTTSIPHCEVQLLLKAQDVHGARLDAGTRLGLDAFISTEKERADRGDICYRLPAR